LTGCATSFDVDGKPLKDENGDCVGELLPLFDCSKTTIVSNTDCVKAFKATMKEAKLAPDDSEWVTSDRGDNLCESDPLTKIKNEKGAIMISKKARDRLVAIGINTVGELKREFVNQPARRKAFCKVRGGSISLEKLAWCGMVNLLPVSSNGLVGAVALPSCPLEDEGA